MASVLLVVPPFHQVFIPAIGVSLLKAALTRDGIPCDLLYLNIPYADEVGASLYSAIASAGRFRALIGEWIFAGDLFGEQAPEPSGYIEEVLLGRYAEDFDRAFADRLTDLRMAASAFLDRAMSRVDWNQYRLVGVSSSYHQSCAGLALLKRLRARFPWIRTALGGANCEGPMGQAMHELFPFVDYVCSGEADRVFPELVRRVLAGQSTSGLPGIHVRGELSLLGDETHTPQVRDLNQLPYPDYDDYFDQFETSSLPAVELPTLALETSRGCWWGQKHHCTFCGLNGQGMTYRAKTPRRALDELDFLLDRYPTRKVYAIDNILDLGYFQEVLPELAKRALPPRLFYETKANLTRAQLRLLARAGVKGFQPGIESFSTAILQLMDKGTTGLQNVRLLKWCAELGLSPAWGILFGFPGEDPAEYQKLAELLPSLTHLEPPAGFGQIRLDRFSPYFAAPAARGLVNVRANLAYRHIFPFPPAALDRLAYHFDYDYADGRDPSSYTAGVKEQVAIWQTRPAGVRLELRLSDDRIEILDSRPAAIRPVTILEGPARLAYLALDAGATLGGVQAALGEAAPSDDQLGAWLESWQADRLVMREGNRYLSLATNLAERVQLPVERFLAELAAGA